MDGDVLALVRSLVERAERALVVVRAGAALALLALGADVCEGGQREREQQAARHHRGQTNSSKSARDAERIYLLLREMALDF